MFGSRASSQLLIARTYYDFGSLTYDLVVYSQFFRWPCYKPRLGWVQYMIGPARRKLFRLSNQQLCTPTQQPSRLQPCTSGRHPWRWPWRNPGLWRFVEQMLHASQYRSTQSCLLSPVLNELQKNHKSNNYKLYHLYIPQFLKCVNGFVLSHQSWLLSLLWRRHEWKRSYCILMRPK